MQRGIQRRMQREMWRGCDGDANGLEKGDAKRVRQGYVNEVAEVGS